jgi:transcriptional regulator with XRE-family HTH domain
MRQAEIPAVIETCLYTDAVMARKSRPEGEETPGDRLARLRKERGWTQVELAERVGITQTLLSDYERRKLRLNADMIVRLAAALETTTDELLRPEASRAPLRRKSSLRLQRRMEKIEKLPPHQQNYLLKTIDGFLKGVSR